MEDDTTRQSRSEQLSIALQDGFTGEEVVISIDGEEVNRVTAHTMWEISLATSFDLIVSQGVRRIEIEIPDRGIRSHHEVQVSGPLWIGVSVLGPTEIVWRESTEPFGYV